MIGVCPLEDGLVKGGDGSRVRDAQLNAPIHGIPLLLD